MVIATPSRRDVLQFTAGAGALPWLAACASATGDELGVEMPELRAVGQPMPQGVPLPETPPLAKSEDSVGFAIVGLGDYALRQMMPRFVNARRAHIAAVVTGNAEKGDIIGAAYGVPEDARYSYENFAEIAEDDRVDAVYIVLPSGLHMEWTEKAFAAGKHVLCEKPMALSSAECERMIAAAEQAHRKLMIAYRCHFEPFNLRAMELMRAQAVGDIRVIRTDQHYRAGPATPAQNWRLSRALGGQGPLEDYGIYGVQSALYLSGEMPESIVARAYRPKDDPRFSEIAAYVGTLMQFPSGAVAQLSTSYDSAGSNRAVVRGTGGTLTMSPATSYTGNRMTLDTGTAEILEPGDPTVQFAGQLDHLADAIRDDIAVRTSGEMGLRDVRLMEAIYLSAAEDRIISMNPDGTMKG
ncbi:MAG: Gfo/Idh/MocA family oxidoreductase [Hyphomonadaceae bacterium]|nr:Gfo/Idh/MocA family oxidoreductase [Hyphomonadaceae bacterium]